MRDRWQVVAYWRFKQREVVTTHWWYWTAVMGAISASLYLAPHGDDFKLSIEEM